MSKGRALIVYYFKSNHSRPIPIQQTFPLPLKTFPFPSPLLFNFPPASSMDIGAWKSLIWWIIEKFAVELYRIIPLDDTLQEGEGKKVISKVVKNLLIWENFERKNPPNLRGKRLSTDPSSRLHIYVSRNWSILLRF